MNQLRLYILTNNSMARRAGVTAIVRDLGFPYGLPQIIAAYADWDNYERTIALFKYNNRHCIVVKNDFGDYVAFRRYTERHVRFRSNMTWPGHTYSIYAAFDDFIRMLVDGKMKSQKYLMVQPNHLAIEHFLLQKVVEIWNSL